MTEQELAAMETTLGDHANPIERRLLTEVRRLRGLLGRVRGSLCEDCGGRLYRTLEREGIDHGDSIDD